MKFTKAIVSVLSIFALLSQSAPAEQLTSSSTKSETNIKAFKSTYAKKVIQDDLVFGMTQVDKMLKDRKPMGNLVKKGDPIYNWTARQFAGEACGERISWNPDENLGLPAGYKADHCSPSKEERPFIRIRSNDGAGNFYDEHLLWECCIFELHNIRNFEAFQKALDEACKGKLSKKEWIRRNAFIEYKASFEVKKFFYQHWAPYLKSKRIDYRAHLWEVDWTPSSFERWLEAYDDPSGYPWNYWGTYYDREIVPCLKSIKSN